MQPDLDGAMDVLDKHDVKVMQKEKETSEANVIEADEFAKSFMYRMRSAAGASHDSPRAQTCTFEGPGFQTSPKFHERTPQERKKERKLWREGKNAKFWAVRRREVTRRGVGGQILDAPTKILNTHRTDTPQHNTTQHNTTQHNGRSRRGGGVLGKGGPGGGRWPNKNKT